MARRKQNGGSLERYYNDLQGIWHEIDFYRSNPMEWYNDIEKYNMLIQGDKVYAFLDGLDDRLDDIRSDILQLQSFPTVEQVYAHVDRETVRQTFMNIDEAENIFEEVLASKGLNLG